MSTQATALSTPDSSGNSFNSSSDEDVDDQRFQWTTRLQQPFGPKRSKVTNKRCGVEISHKCFQLLAGDHHVLSGDELMFIKQQLDAVMLGSSTTARDQCGKGPATASHHRGVLDEQVLAQTHCTNLLQLCQRVVESLTGPYGALVTTEYRCLGSTQCLDWILSILPITEEYDSQESFFVGSIGVIDDSVRAEAMEGEEDNQGEDSPPFCYRILGTRIPYFSLNLNEQQYLNCVPMSMHGPRADLKIWSHDVPGLPGKDFWMMLRELEWKTWNTSQVMIFYPSEVFTPTGELKKATTVVATSATTTRGSLITFPNIIYSLAADQNRRPPKAEWGFLPIVYYSCGEHHVVSLYFKLPRQNQCFARHEPLVLHYHDSNSQAKCQGAATETFEWISSLFLSAEVPLTLKCERDSFTHFFVNGWKGAWKMCGHFSLNIFLTLAIFGKPLAFRRLPENRMSLLFDTQLQGCKIEDMFDYVDGLLELSGRGIAPGNPSQEDELLNLKERVFHSHLWSVRYDNGTCPFPPDEEDRKFMLTTGTEGQNLPNPNVQAFSLRQAARRLQPQPLRALEVRELGNRLLTEAGVFNDTKKCLFCHSSLPGYCEDVHLSSHHPNEVEALLQKLDLINVSLFWSQCRFCKLPVEKASLRDHEQNCRDTHGEFFYPKVVLEKIRFLRNSRPLDAQAYLIKHHRQRCFFCWSDFVKEDDQNDHCSELHASEIENLLPKLEKVLQDHKAGVLDSVQILEIKEMRLFDQITTPLPTAAATVKNVDDDDCDDDGAGSLSNNKSNSHTRLIAKYFTGSKRCDDLFYEIRKTIDEPTICVQVGGIQWKHRQFIPEGGDEASSGRNNVLDVDEEARERSRGGVGGSSGSYEEFTHRFPLRTVFRMSTSEFKRNTEFQEKLKEQILKTKTVHDEMLHHLSPTQPPTPHKAGPISLLMMAESEHAKEMRLRQVLQTISMKIPNGFLKSPTMGILLAKEVVLLSDSPSRHSSSISAATTTSSTSSSTCGLSASSSLPPAHLKRVSSLWECSQHGVTPSSPTTTRDDDDSAGMRVSSTGRCRSSHLHQRQPVNSGTFVQTKVLDGPPLPNPTTGGGRARYQDSMMSTESSGLTTHGSPAPENTSFGFSSTSTLPTCCIHSSPPPLINPEQHLHQCQVTTLTVREEDSTTLYLGASSPFAPSSTVIGHRLEEDNQEDQPCFKRGGQHC